MIFEKEVRNHNPKAITAFVKRFSIYENKPLIPLDRQNVLDFLDVRDSDDSPINWNQLE